MEAWDIAFKMASMGLSRQEVSLYPLPGSSLPDFLIASERVGLVAIGLLVEPLDATQSVDRVPYRKNLAKRAKRLKALLSLDPDAPISVKVWPVKDPGPLKPDQVKMKMFDASWVEGLPDAEVSDSLLNEVREAFGEPRVFETSRRARVEDPNLQNRQLERFRLDDAQNELARNLSDSQFYLTGPAGSGKTLVLLSRIKYVLDSDPRARVLLVCYNKTLASSLRRSITDNSRVDVFHFHGLASHLQLRFPSSSDERRSQMDSLRAQQKGPSHVYDLVLVDEAQDLKVGWLHWLLSLLKPDRFGLVFAGDSKQAIYGLEEGMRDRFIDRELTRIELTKPYRCTNQILDVIGVLDPGYAVEERSEAQDGEPVQLIWAQNKKQMAEAIAHLIGELLEGAEGYTLKDMAVLVPNYFWLQGEDGIARVLEDKGIILDVTWKTRGDLLDTESNTLKLMTIHSAKGLEFPVVFLVGLESIKDDSTNDELAPVDPESVMQRSKLNLVGPSRARDILYIFYSKANAYLLRLKEAGAPVAESVYPDDYEGH